MKMAGKGTKKAKRKLDGEIKALEADVSESPQEPEVSAEDEKKGTQVLDVEEVKKILKRKKVKKSKERNVTLVSIQRRGKSEEKTGRKTYIEKPYVGLVSILDSGIRERSNNGWERESGKVKVLEPIEVDCQLRYRRGNKEGCFHGFVCHKTELPLDEYHFLERVVYERERINAIKDIAINVVAGSGQISDSKTIGSMIKIATVLDHRAVDLENDLNFPQQEAEEIERIYASGDYSMALYLECLKVAGGLEGSRTVLEEAEDVFSKVLENEKPGSESLRLAEEFRRAVLKYRETRYGSRSENLQLFGLEYGIKPKPKKRGAKEARMDAQKLEISELEKEAKKRERKAKAWERTKDNIRNRLREKGHTTQRIRVADFLPAVLEGAEKREKTKKLKALKPEVRIYPLPGGIRAIPEEPMPDTVRVITLPKEGFAESVVVWEGEVKRLFSNREGNGFRLAAPAVVGSSLSLASVLPETVKIEGKEVVNGSIGLTFEGPVKSVDSISLDDFLFLERYFLRRYVRAGVEEGYTLYNEIIDKISRENVEKFALETYVDEEGRERSRDASFKKRNPLRSYRTAIGDRTVGEALTFVTGINVSRGEERKANVIRRKYQDVPGLDVLINSLQREGMIIGYKKFIESLRNYEGALSAFSTFYGQQQGEQLAAIELLLDEFSERFETKGHRALISRILGDAKEQWDLTTMAFSLAKATETIKKVMKEKYRPYTNPVHEYLSGNSEGYFSEAGLPEDKETEARKLIARFQSSAIGCATLGDILMERGNLEEAKECFETAIMRNDNDPLIYEKFANCYFELGKSAQNKKKKLDNFATAFEAYVITSSLTKEEADRLYKLAEIKETKAEQLQAHGEEKEGEKIYNESKDHKKDAEGKYQYRKDIEKLLKGMAGSFSPEMRCNFLDYQTWIKLGDCCTESGDWKRAEWAYANASPLLKESLNRRVKNVNEIMALGNSEETQGEEERARVHYQEAEGLQKEAEYEAKIGEELKEKIEEAGKRVSEMKRQKRS